MNETIETKNVVENEDLVEIFVPASEITHDWGVGGCGANHI